MFASNALPPPSFGHEHRPLRLTSEVARPPQGGCHFQHPASQNHRCLCQTYQHNRSAPGNVCDCGHSACYHSQTPNDGRLTPDRVVSALVEKVKKLEELVIRERESRNDLIQRERQAWEKEAWVLREALAPFYRSETEMKKKLTQLENKLDNVHDDVGQLREHVSAPDDIKFNLDQQFHVYEAAQSRKRKPSIGQEPAGVMSPESNYTASISSRSSVSDATSTSSQKSPKPPSPMNIPLSAGGLRASPRSSGVLNLASDANRVNGSYLPRSHPPHQLPSPDDEPRSSGFLSINLTERLRNRHTNSVLAKDQIPPGLSNVHIQPARTPECGLPSPPQHKIPSGVIPVSGLLSEDSAKTDLGRRSPKKRKQDTGMTGLELLANVATPLAQRG